MNEMFLAVQKLQSLQGGLDISLKLKDAAFNLIEQELRRRENQDGDPDALQNAAKQFEQALQEAIAISPDITSKLPNSRIQAAIDIIRPLILGRTDH